MEKKNPARQERAGFAASSLAAFIERPQAEGKSAL
jgi:hypothetical protein